MPKTPDFAALDLRDALDLAALIEEEARERYLELAEQMEALRTKDTAAFFRSMAAYEAKHGAELSARREALFAGAPRRVDRSMLWEEEAPGYEQVRPFMTPREAMLVALSAEKKAEAFFVAALPTVENADVKKLFAELRSEEVEHQRLVQAQLEKLPPDPEAKTEDYEDEPVAQ